MLKALAAVFVALALVSPALAATVGMNFRFNIDSQAADVIHVNETSYLGQNLNSTFRPSRTYISSEQEGRLAALIFAGGGFLNIRLDTESDPYNFQMTQEEQNNRFLIGFTSGAWQDIDQQASSRRVPQRTLGNLEIPFSNPQHIFLRLQYDTLNLIGSIASGQLLVKNLGNRNIQLDVVG